MEEELDEDGDLVTSDSLKLVYTFAATTLIQGIWWSSAYPVGSNEGYLKGIKQLEFSFPDSMGGFTFKTSSIKNVKKERDFGQSDTEIIFFPKPILTDKLVLSNLAFATGNKDPSNRNTLRFSLEFFGCSDYQADKGKVSLELVFILVNKTFLTF